MTQIVETGFAKCIMIRRHFYEECDDEDFVPLYKNPEHTMFTQVDIKLSDMRHPKVLGNILVHWSASQSSFLKSLDNKEARLLIKFLNSQAEVDMIKLKDIVSRAPKLPFTIYGSYFMYRDVKMYNVCYEEYNKNCDHPITKDDNLLLITNTYSRYFHSIIVC